MSDFAVPAGLLLWAFYTGYHIKEPEEDRLLRVQIKPPQESRFKDTVSLRLNVP